MVQQGHYGELSSILGAIPAQQQLAAPEGDEAALEEPEAPEPVTKLGATGEAEEEAEEEGSEGEEEGSEGEEEEGDEEAQQDETEEGSSGEEEEAAADARQQQPPRKRQQQPQRGGQQPQRPRPHRMQTFVFSATLTLPAKLRHRLRKGGGGASGSSDLDALMDQIPFG